VRQIIRSLRITRFATRVLFLSESGCVCNTGLTFASPPPVGCTSSVLVTPINPETGGTSVDGNWELATPYPSSGVAEEAPNPCKLAAWGPAWGPAWVDTPWSAWLNPSDGLSQWITPEAIAPTAASGWYVYRTPVSVPTVTPRYDYYLLKVAGRLLADNYLRLGVKPSFTGIQHLD
jgi:hypothetical protein